MGASRRRVAMVVPPTGAWCREDRCQSRYRFELIPTQRAPMEELECAGAALAAGAEAIVIDAPGAREDADGVLAQLRAFAPDLVVLSVTFGSLEDDLHFGKRAADVVPGATFAIRGAPAYVHAEGILQHAPWASLCLRGDYELAIAALVRRSLPVPGCVHRDVDGGASVAPSQGSTTDDLDGLPRPAHHAVPARRYRVRGLGAPQATIRVQRGCPYPCTYCLVGTVSGSVARHRSPESIAREVADVVASGTRHFYLRADTFSLDRRWAIEVACAIARHAPTARWVTTTRADCVDEPLIEELARGGCYGVSFGIDVASDAIARHVRKPVRREDAERAMRACDRHGVLSLAYLMIGFAWDTPETLEETGSFARFIRPDLLTVHYAHPYPGTRYAEQTDRIGMRVLSKQAQAEPAVEPDGLSVDALHRATRRMLRHHYTNPRVLASLVRKGTRLIADHVRH